MVEAVAGTTRRIVFMDMEELEWGSNGDGRSLNAASFMNLNVVLSCY